MTSTVLQRPIVGILYNFTPPTDIVRCVKSFDPEIKLDVVVLAKPEISEDELNSLKSCEILIVDPNLPVDHQLTFKLANLKWMHSLLAGVERLTRSVMESGSRPDYVLTRNGGYFGKNMAEYVIGQIIANERHFHEMKQNQRNKLWNRMFYRTLSDVSLGIIGFGDIGKEIAMAAKTFQMKIWALVKVLPPEDQRCPDVDEYRMQVPDLLSSCDYVVSVLPSIPSTDSFFDGDILSHCSQKKSVFINIGRGNVVKEETILHALACGWISRAILDVFSVEPLPANHPLWRHPQVTITPHVSAAGQSIDPSKVARDFLKNYELYMKNKQLAYTVDWTKGY